jgi:hypothetical protein
MGLQYGVNLRNAKMNAVTTQLGATATLKIFSGTVPANCAAADPSGPLCTISLPNPPFATAVSGAIAKSGVWSASASGTGTAATYRIYDSSAVCQLQGNVTTDLVLDNTAINSGQTVTVNSYTLTEANT